MGFLSFLFGKKEDPTSGGAKSGNPGPPAAPAPGVSSWETEGAVPQEMAAKEVLELYESADPPVFIDVRERHELEAEGMIPGAIHIPLGDLASRCGELEPELSVVVYCASGMRSMDGGALLLSKGFQDVSNLNGGFNAWQGPKEPPPPRRR